MNTSDGVGKMRRFQCGRCGGTGQQPEGCWNYITRKHDEPAGTCTVCNGEGLLGPMPIDGKCRNGCGENCSLNPKHEGGCFDCWNTGAIGYMDEIKQLLAERDALRAENEKMRKELDDIERHAQDRALYD